MAIHNDTLVSPAVQSPSQTFIPIREVNSAKVNERERVFFAAHSLTFLAWTEMGFYYLRNLTNHRGTYGMCACEFDDVIAALEGK